MEIQKIITIKLIDRISETHKAISNQKIKQDYNIFLSVKQIEVIE